MRIACLIPVLVLACGGGDDAVTTTVGESSSTDPSTSGSPSTTAPSTEESSTTMTATSEPPGTSSSEAGSSSGTTDATEDESSSSADDSSSSGELPDGCVGIEVIDLLDPFVDPIDAATWAPGGSVTVGVTMHNTDDEDFTNYPSIVVESDNAMVTSGAPGNQLFAVLAGMSTEVTVTFDADDAIARDTDVTFTIRMASLNDVCPNGDVVEVVATVE